MSLLEYRDPAMLSWFIGANQLIGPGYQPEDLTQLAQLWASRQLGHNNPVVSGLEGAEPQAPVVLERTVPINMLIAGDVNQDGTPYTDLAVGIDTNYLALELIVGHPGAWGGPTIGTLVQRPSGVWMGGGIQPSLSPILSVSGGVAKCVINVVIPRPLTVIEGSE